MTPSGLVGEMLSGFILDTNGAGRFDLLIYPDGVLAVRGGYGDTVALSAQGAFSGAGILSPSRPALPARISRLLPLSRADALAGDARNFFIPRSTLLGVELKKRWYGHSIVLITQTEPAGRRFQWKPAFNRFEAVQQSVSSAFGAIVRVV